MLIMLLALMSVIRVVQIGKFAPSHAVSLGNRPNTITLDFLSSLHYLQASWKV